MFIHKLQQEQLRNQLQIIFSIW